MAGGVAVGTLQFVAPNYTFDVPDGLTINGIGVQASLANAPTFNVIGFPNHSTPSINFNGISSAGTAQFFLGQPIDTNGGFNAGFINFFGSSTAAQATITVRDQSSTTFHNSSTAGQATLIVDNNGFVGFFDTSSGAQAKIINNAGGEVKIADLTTVGTSFGSIAGGGTYNLGSKQLTVGSNGDSTTVSGTINGAGGSLVKVGSGTLTLSGVNTYTGGTTISGGAISISSDANLGGAGGMLSLNGGTTLQTTASLSSARNVTLGIGFETFDTMANTLTLSGPIGGTGSITKIGSGTLNLAGNNTFTGGTTVASGTLLVNGSLASGVFVNNGATLGGNGTIAGSVINAGTLAPGNSIGLLRVNGSYTQAAGSAYQVELNAAGQNDRININGAPGTASIQGGTVQVMAQPGIYGRSTTYTIVNATGGVTGTYSGITGNNFEFLMPSLSYDANNVFLTLALPSNAFENIPETPNQKEVAADLDKTFPNATGDFATIIGALASLARGQGRAVLDALSGQQYADFGTMNVNNSAMFMNAIGQQMAMARGGAPAGQRLALAQACEVEACEGASRFSVWGSLLGGLGSVVGDGNGYTLTYNFGGAATGIDYRIDRHFLVGISAGYTHGTEWVNSLLGQGWTDNASFAVYGSFAQGALYVDALAGYAYFNNQLERQIVIPGLQPRTAAGSTGANQFLGQVETGYKLDVYAPAQASITPFGRLQISNVNQNGFTESGAQALSLNVAQQTTNSLRTVLGADFGSAVPLGNERKLDLAVRLGWQHEFAYTGRPITAAFSGAPSASFTVYAATPQRDSAVVGLSASTTIAEATQLYLRYDGEIASGTDNHAINVGVRFSW